MIQLEAKAFIIEGNTHLYEVTTRNIRVTDHHKRITIEEKFVAAEVTAEIEITGKMLNDIIDEKFNESAKLSKIDNSLLLETVRKLTSSDRMMLYGYRTKEGHHVFKELSIPSLGLAKENETFAVNLIRLENNVELAKLNKDVLINLSEIGVLDREVLF